ncbi:MAG: permease [Saprospiraceae bacterium]|nr:MAG: permease [Saprospiraceae bacterium]
MNLSYFIARKVAATGTRSFSRLIIRIAVIAVALSVAVMIIATSLISGFKKEISSKIFGFWGHIHITDTSMDRSLLDVVPVDINQDFYPSLDTVTQVRYWTREKVLGQEMEVEKTSKGGIRHIQVFAIKPGIIKVNDEIEGIILKGIDRDFDWQFLENYLQEGNPIDLTDTLPSRQILISRQTANRLKVGVNDSLNVHFVEKGEELTRRFYICGIYKTGLEEYDQKFALVDIQQIRQILGWTNEEVSGFEVFIDNMDDLIPITEYIYYDRLPTNLYAETIREKFREIFEWLELQNINEVVILALMILVAIINMVTALMILILERTNMIGTLKALGGSNWSIRKIFIYYAAYIILTGLFWGNVVGIGLCFLQDKFEFIKLSEENYYLSVAPVEVNFWSVFILNLGTLVITLLFLVGPSYLVTRIDPVKAIRFK